MANRLAGETSPYLRQHADNPVDWYPWGDEAFERARAEGKPILLSIGYSSCHWCHVMAHESFEDDAIAAQMNEQFVSVKVDREERPDVDSVYMAFTQAMTGQGGWPMTVFLTPELEPFYAGTYFPPEDGHGRPGFPRLLDAITEAWTGRRDEIVAQASDVTKRLRESSRYASPGAGSIGPGLPDQVAEALRSAYDPMWGGFGGAPKFPSPSNLEFLLMQHARAGEGPRTPSSLDMVLHTLRRMAQGGIYDHLGGGFARYSVDGQWLVPHFEKMLYDNAQLIRTYLHAYQLTGEEHFAAVARGTIAYLESEMLTDEGGFTSAQDADSEGIEGKFFVWTSDEIDEVLGEDDGPIARAVWHITASGNFEDPHHPEFGRRNVLSRSSPLEQVARDYALDEAALNERVESMRARLLDARSQRVAPGLDDKVLTSWNGLALAGIAEAARILDDVHLRELAERNAAFLHAQLWRDGRLLHTYKEGVAKIDGMLEDYAYLGLGLVELYRATGNVAHLDWARELFEVMLARFHDDPAAGGSGGFFEAAPDGEALLLQQKPFFDAATPSGNGAAALLALWIGRYLGDPRGEEVAREVIGLVQPQIAQAGAGFGTVLQAVELLLAPHREIAIVGDAAARAAFERELAARFLPTVVTASADASGGLPLLEGRDVEDGAAAYVCVDMVCDLPARTVADFVQQLG